MNDDDTVEREPDPPDEEPETSENRTEELPPAGATSAAPGA